ncbi:MAG: DegT/DnrJ/EryC1/StrS family aminotransferase, partial [Planctomycetota bacterium]|nr:DegT/DnrJ/EryC1/StrS family aminotransferase [Planctomycetota bacterium]
WVDIGSSYVPSEIVCAFLYGQLEMMDQIADRRRQIYAFYSFQLEELQRAGLLRRPHIPAECQSNFHMFYVLLPDGDTRDRLLEHLRSRDIHAVFHYVPLHVSPVGKSFDYREGDLPVTEEVSRCLLRLPFYYEITREEQQRIVDEIGNFLRGRAVKRQAA